MGAEGVGVLAAVEEVDALPGAVVDGAGGGGFDVGQQGQEVFEGVAEGGAGELEVVCDQGEVPGVVAGEAGGVEVPEDGGEGEELRDEGGDLCGVVRDGFEEFGEASAEGLCGLSWSDQAHGEALPCSVVALLFVLM